MLLKLTYNNLYLFKLYTNINNKNLFKNFTLKELLDYIIYMSKQFFLVLI